VDNAEAVTELETAFEMQRRARMAGDDDALAVASRRRFRALVSAYPELARVGVWPVTGEVLRSSEIVLPYEEWKPRGSAALDRLRAASARRGW